MKRKADGLLVKFAIIFIIFTVVTLVCSGIVTYINQMSSYRKQCQDNIKAVGEYLASLIEADEDEFVEYQKFYLAHYEELKVPIEFDSFKPAKDKLDKLMAERYPGKVLGMDIKAEELDEETQLAFFMYNQQYWQLAFEKAAKDFDMPYAYYNVFYPGEHDCMYMIDGERTTPNDHLEEGEEPDPENDRYMYLGDRYYHDPEKYYIEWNTWVTGEGQNEFQVWDNKWGHTYAYYTPVVINGQKMGFVGTEIEVAKVNSGILRNTIEQTVGIAVVLIIAVCLVLAYINREYISKIIRLSDDVKQYSQDKNPAIVSVIEKEGGTGDEISALANQTAAMVLELENYMKNLLVTTKELSESRQHADDMRVLATKDALTGIRNKTAYDNEVKQLEWSLADGFTEFGLAMIDLNFLKRINDTYGHEQGNVAIKRLCHLVCTVFEHSPVFRIGGDEFIVVLKNHDYEHIDELTKVFNDRMEEMAKDDKLEQWEKISAAIGVAFFDPQRDNTVENVFKRADKEMYERKKEMKAVRTE